MKFPTKKIIWIGAGMFFAVGAAVHADTLYQNTTTDIGNSLTFANGQTIGNEIIMGNASPFDSVTNFSFEIFSTQSTFTGGAGVQMEVFLYKNDGTAFNGYPTPGTSLYDSGAFTLLTPQQYVGGNAATLTFDLTGSPVIVPQDFTLAAMVTGLAGGDTVGLELFDPAGVGSNYHDYWLNNGTSWGLFTNGVGSSFGAEVLGTPVPEPTTISLGAVGAAFLTGFIWLRRRQNQVKQS